MNDLELAAAAARAGAAVVRAAGRGFRTEWKGAANPVTEVDRAAEEAILDVLRAARPDDRLVAEESGGVLGSGRHWIVDPLDGTVNFVHGIPHVAVSVAVYRGRDGLAGAVLDVYRDEMFTAAPGEGARLDGAPIRVSACAEPAEAVVATGFPYDRTAHAAAYAASQGPVLRHTGGLRRFGSAALDLCWVAAGRFDAYWELGVAPWDIAAGLIILREAGGRATDPAGRDVVPADTPIVASNGRFHDRLLGWVIEGMPAHLGTD